MELKNSAITKRIWALIKALVLAQITVIMRSLVWMRMEIWSITVQRWVILVPLVVVVVVVVVIRRDWAWRGVRVEREWLTK